MAIYTKESLERLRERLDLPELISSYVDLKKSGATYKGLCPFHDEKSPSFMVKSGDTSYHCFGCGAHGDAIQFLMSHRHLSFGEAVEFLAERYHVHLEQIEKNEKDEKPGIDKTLLKEALKEASLFFQCYLLHSLEGEEPFLYLLRRGLSLGFIQRFEVGLAPKQSGIFKKVMREKGIKDEVLREAGLLAKERDDEFFRERIMFPIRDRSGHVIGFSGRKYKETTSGGKYINTFETPLFKKSRILFGLNYSYGRIAKEKKAYIVEGQIDCLRLINEGFDLTVAALGTAFGEDHVRELERLGIREVHLLFDGDEAGQTAASKVGNLFQKKGIDVKVVNFPPKMDPDSFLQKEGVKKLNELIAASENYLSFQVAFLSKNHNVNTPAGKNELVTALTKQIREWEEPIMVHESLKRLAALTHIPEDVIGVGNIEKTNISFMGTGASTQSAVDPIKILEFDLLRWLLLFGEEKEEAVRMVSKHLTPNHFWNPVSKKMFEAYLKAFQEKKKCDLLTILIEIDEKEGPDYLEEILSKKINKERFEKHFQETVQKLLDREWLQKRELIKTKIHSGILSEDKALELMKEFDELKKNRPKICL